MADGDPMTSAQSPDDWPTTEEYDRALLNRAQTVSDLDIKNGALLQDKTSPIHLGGGIVCAYKVGDWVVRCFTGKPPADLPERYAAVNAYLAEYTLKTGQRLDFLVPTFWVSPGVRVGGRDWPFVKVAFIHNGTPLGSALSENREDAHFLRALAANWRSMMVKMEQAQIAHGDLDVTNVMVWDAPNGGALQLIDYDAMYAPPLRGRARAEFGHEHFQPAEQSMQGYNAEMDRFSSLVIYLSIMALASDPSMWDACDADETSRLLVGAPDFAKPEISANFSRLQRLRIPDVSKCLAALRTSLEQRRMPPALEDVLAGPDPAMSRPLEPPRPATARRPVRPLGTGGPVIPSQDMLAAKPQLGSYQPVASTSQAGARASAPLSRPLATSLAPAQQARRPGASLAAGWIVVTVIVIAIIALFAVIVASAQNTGGGGGATTFHALIMALMSSCQ